MARKASEEQVLYANILNRGMLIGLLALVVTFVLYGARLMEPRIPLSEVQNYWVLPVNEYLELSGIHPGWAWIGKLGYGDMLNLLPIAFLSGLTIICYLAIIPGLLRKKDTAYVVLAIVEVAVLVVAASGILGSGGH
ncbi:MAG: hypothetical protein Kow0025_19580 [Thermodesulfovibrionales bacterium]